MRGQRKKKGGAIAFSAVLALVMVVMGLGFLFLSLYMGGQTETKNAVDAGTLNLGKQSLDQISVQLLPSLVEQNFRDVTNDDGDENSQSNDNKVTLRRINRIWGRALLMGINADAAKNTDGNDKDMEGHAQDACDAADAISSRLSDQLTNASNLENFFTDYADRNSVRMIGNSAKVQVVSGAGWATSLMDREKESNLVLKGTSGDNFYLPKGYSLDADVVTQCTRNPIPTGKYGGPNFWFLKGYKPISAADRTFWQVPFVFEEKPHLIAKSAFETNTNSTTPLSWNKAVPNAYSAEGKVLQGATGEKAMSWVLTNPRQPFTLSMPHTFLKIHVEKPEARFWFFPTAYPPIQFGPSQTYGYTGTDSVTGVPMPQGGVGCSTVTPVEVNVGLDVVGRTLDDLIFKNPDGDTGDLEQLMTSRMNEMLSRTGGNKDASYMHSVLGDGKTIAYLLKGDQDFYMFSPDGGQSVVVYPDYLAIPLAREPNNLPWLAPIITNDPDGSEVTKVPECTMFGPFLFFPTVTPDAPLFTTPLNLPGWGKWGKQVYWTPGSGYNGNLGVVRVERWTDLYNLGVSV